MTSIELQDWLRAQCNEYEYDLRGVFRVAPGAQWPLTAANASELEARMREHLLPLPKEPAALANVLEVSIVDFLLDRIDATGGSLIGHRGGERVYPDLEVTGPGVGDAFYAVDIKVAQRRIPKKAGVAPTQTQSRITLYTGNTYFAYPKLHWSGALRPFADYVQHLDIIGIYTLNQASASRVDDLELIVQEPWKIGSKKRSSTTREYIGAVQALEDLREGRGEFKTEAEFYKFWRSYKFDIGEAVKQ